MKPGGDEVILTGDELFNDLMCWEMKLDRGQNVAL
jgi:hypothetical protein